jgi:hypothetical protein
MMHDMIWMASVMRTNIVLEVLASDEVETPPFPLHRRRNEVSPENARLTGYSYGQSATGGRGSSLLVQFLSPSVILGMKRTV